MYTRCSIKTSMVTLTQTYVNIPCQMPIPRKRVDPGIPGPCAPNLPRMSEKRQDLTPVA